MNTIATLGPDGSYSSQATRNVSPGASIKFYGNNQEVIKKVPQHIAGVSPIYNKYGTIVLQQLEAIYQLGKKYPDTLRLLGTHKLQIEHVLAGTNANIQAEELTHVFSHPQALLQCNPKIQKLTNIIQMEATSTVSEIANISETQAVICSLSAAQKQGLHIYDRNFAPEDNHTEFAVITTDENTDVNDFESLNGEMKIAILSILNNPLALANALSMIGESGVSLNSIHSHPNGKGGVDFPILMDSTQGVDLNSLYKELEKQKASLKIL